MLYLSCNEKDNLESFKRFDANNWEEIKERITYKVVNKKTIRDDNVIHQDCMDLAKVFIISELSMDRKNLDCYVITKEDLKRFDKNKEDIIKHANENISDHRLRRMYDLKSIGSTKEAFYPISFFPAESMLRTDSNAFIRDSWEDEKNVIIVSNKYNALGASYMLDFSTLREIREEMDSDFYIIPYSIHQFMCISKKYLNDIKHNVSQEEIEDDLLDMTYNINSENRYDNDILSYRIYYYSVSDGECLISIKQKL